MAEAQRVVVADAAALAAEALARVQRAAAAAMMMRGRFTLALCGGSTPRTLYRLLGDDPARLDLARTEVFFGDERCVPPDHADSNYGQASALWLARAGADPARVHRMRGEDPDPDAAARAYEAELRAALGPEPALDLCLLGMGADGHTASLFPWDAALGEQERLCVAVHPKTAPTPRLTLTLPCFAGAEALLFLVAGSDKAAALARTLAPAEVPTGGPPAPARAVLARARKATLLCDTAAAALLGGAP